MTKARMNIPPRLLWQVEFRRNWKRVRLPLLNTRGMLKGLGNLPYSKFSSRSYCQICLQIRLCSLTFSLSSPMGWRGRFTSGFKVFCYLSSTGSCMGLFCVRLEHLQMDIYLRIHSAFRPKTAQEILRFATRLRDEYSCPSLLHQKRNLE